MNDGKISPVQLSFMLIGFLFGSSAILEPSSGAYQDAWLANFLGLGGGLVLTGIYLYLAKLNPDKTLIEILRDHLGKYLGSLIAVLYIWYFFHLGALVARDFGEFTVTTTYPETPILVVVISFGIVTVYAVREGFQALAKASELLVPVIVVVVLLSFFLSIGLYDPKNFLPFLEHGFSPVIKASIVVLTFPFGEMVVFLMVFPFLTDRNKSFPIGIFSVLIVGLLIQIVTVRDLMVLGPDMFMRDSFPANTSSRLIADISISPLIGVNLLIAGGIKIAVCMYAAALGIVRLFHLDDYRPLVLPVAALTIALSIWVYHNVLEMFRWGFEIWPYYSIPFQIVIPLVLLIISWIKKKTGRLR